MRYPNQLSENNDTVQILQQGNAFESLLKAHARVLEQSGKSPKRNWMKWKKTPLPTEQGYSSRGEGYAPSISEYISELT